MSALETPNVEQHSSVKIYNTAKGDPVVEVKAYTHDLAALDETRERAVATFKQAMSELTGVS